MKKPNVENDMELEVVFSLKLEPSEFDRTYSNSDSDNHPELLGMNISKLKKKVRFADECGKALEAVQIMTEPSDIPPKINKSIIQRHRKLAAAKFNGKFDITSIDVFSFDDDDDNDEGKQYLNKKHATWKLNFIQPASEYLKFHETLEKHKVALENVILRNNHCKMLGTIKVVNISFEKKVFVRFTSDSWKSYSDCPAMYHSSFCKTYDTFAFETLIPLNDGDVNKIEFCVCYIADGIEHWDSNNGKNYSLIPEN